MKLFTTIILTVLAVAALGQTSTYLNPMPGNTHNYSATVNDTGDPDEVRWYVATDAAGNNKAVYGTDYTFVTSGYNSTNDQLEGTAVYDVDITWGATVQNAEVYYVFIDVDDDQTQCTNHMALRVQIAAEFNALVYNVTGSATPGTVIPDDPGNDVVDSDCPVIINPVYNQATGGHTDIGTTIITYRVEREFSLVDWSFEYNLYEALGNPFNVVGITMEDESGSQIYSGTGLTGTQGVDASEDYVLVYVEVTNQQGVNLDINLELVTDNNNTADDNGNTDGNTSDNTDNYVIEAMPEITGFGSND
ncbi:MAG: hypothetical protein PF436_03425 [Prolixibacteraceae bacterium]|jgi:hypothetical protein|nr:hypothetical protein [Prolixibacteraceae bacterium]